jgi:2-polyprenyl-3-methyl-5-hydroxy-6-metoxy-1,4-benzoquinol methylase
MSDNKSNLELLRLESLGWNSQSAFRFLPKTVMNSQEHLDLISFPNEAYKIDNDNQDLNAFWSRFRAQSIFDQLKRYKINHLWEVGSGDGSAAIPLSAKGIGIIAVEPIREGATYTEKNGITSFCCFLEELKLPNASIEAIGLFDVLEHLEDSRPLLNEVRRCLSDQGHLVITVPMYMFLFSDFDSKIGHFRRYSKKVIEAELNNAGFEIESFQYMFSFLVLPAYFIRRILPKGRKVTSYVNLHKSMNRQLSITKSLIPSLVLNALYTVEKWLKPKFGLSSLIVAKKSKLS